MRRKEERSKQGQTNNKAKQHSTPKAVTFLKKNELPQVGLQPTQCTMYSYMYILSIFVCWCMQRSYGGLKDEDRIFTNLYGRHDWRLKGAQARVGRGARGRGGG